MASCRETWDMLQFGLRLGTNPRQLVTTTPRATPLMLALVKDAGTRVTRIRTEDNAGNLAAGFLDTMRARYGGTRLGRQELDGELIADREDGLWRREQLEALVVRKPGPLGRIVVAVDPPASARPGIPAAASSPSDWMPRAARWCSPMARSRAQARRAGRAVAGSTAASTPIAWWPRSTRAATW
jgi:phage terminase large subunit-like protein